MRYDAIVIGGGPAGATTSLLLARAGWSVAVVEKSDFPRRKVCGEFMSATNAPLFAELDLTEEVSRAAGPEIHRVGLFAGETLLEAPMPKGAGWGSALGRDVLDTLLMARAVAAGAVSWQPWTAEDLREENGVHICTVSQNANTQEIQAPIVIAAHGSWERGRLPTNIARAHVHSDLLGFKAHFTRGKLSADLMPLVVFPGGYGGMVNSDAGRLSFSCCIRRDALEQARRRYGSRTAHEAVLAHVSESCRGVAEALHGADLAGSWLSAGPINTGIRERYEGGIFRVGNLAGEAHPIVAEGISMAMQSAWMLAQRLVRTSSTKATRLHLGSVGQAYSADWSRHFKARILSAQLFAYFAVRPRPVSLFVPMLKRAPALLTIGAALSGKTRALPGVARHRASRAKLRNRA